jgi:DNA-directed RNA polymerase subunit RPC12/RpoP
LTTINLYHCKHCSQRVCLKHRDKDDHGCDATRGEVFNLETGRG